MYLFVITLLVFIFQMVLRVEMTENKVPMIPLLMLIICVGAGLLLLIFTVVSITALCRKLRKAFSRM
jgi:hypothetical protein